MASNLRRSKRTIGRRLSYVEAKLNTTRRVNVPKKLGAGVVTSPSLGSDVTTTLNTIQTTADGKNSIYRQPTQPPGSSYAEGDLWFDSSSGGQNKFYRFTSGSWTGFTLGDNALASISANKLTAGTIDASVITVSNINAGNIVTGTMSSIELRAGTPVDGLYPFRVTTAGEVRAVSGTIGAFTLSDDVLTAEVTPSGWAEDTARIELGKDGQIYTKNFHDSFFGNDWTNEIYINKNGTGDIVVTGDGSGYNLTSTISTSQIQTRQFKHDDSDTSGTGKYTAYGSYVNFGDGDTLGWTMRIVVDNDLYGQGTGGVSTLDVLVNANGTLVAPSSSIRFKENVNNLDVDYKKILAIQPVTFQYKDASETAEGQERAIEYGVIAEQVEEAGVPELVNYKDGVPFAVPYSKMPVFLLEVCRKQEEAIEDLKARIAALES